MPEYPHRIAPRPSTPRSRQRLLFFAVALAALLAPAAPRAAAWSPSPAVHPVHGVINGLLEKQVLHLEGLARHFTAAGQQGPMVRVELTSTRDVAATVRSVGGQVEADIHGSVLAAQVPASRVDDLAALSGVSTLFPVQRFQLEDDLSVADIQADKAWTLSDQSGNAIQGQHVIIGLVDTGIDYHNPDFQNPDGSTRIKYIWDQTQGGNPPAGFSFGYECDSSTINSGACPEKDTDGHGTHVAGIAAGNGRSSSPPQQMGVAPQADIIMVKTDLQSDHILAAWQYLVGKAKQLGEPIVINDSFGEQQGPHDGTEPEAQALDQLAGPGVIFVKSAGNLGGQSGHIGGAVVQGSMEGIEFDTTGYLSSMKPITALGFSVFFPAGDLLEFTLVNNTTGQAFGPVDATGMSWPSKDGTAQVTLYPSPWDQQYRMMSVALTSIGGKPLTGHYTLLMQGQKVVDSGHYDAWMLQEGSGQFLGGDDKDTLSIPADAHQVITVANYATRTTWVDATGQPHSVCELLPCPGGTLSPGQLVSQSSEGPTADGRQKPDIAAPGTMIVSSLSRDATVKPTYITQDGKHFILGGTSMASPHVAGVVALMLQVNPHLDVQAADQILRSTARHDQFTGTDAWTPGFGAGKVDAYAAVQAAITASRLALPTATPVKRVKCKKGYRLVHGKCKKQKKKA